MDRSLVPPLLPPVNNPTTTTHRSSVLTRQQWVFLLLVGASSFMAFHAVYTSLRLYDSYDDRHHVSFQAPPIEQKKGNTNQGATKATMSTLHQDEPNRQRTQDLPQQQEQQQQRHEEAAQSSNQSKRENDIVETPLERQSEVNSTNDPSRNEQTQSEQRVKEETKQQQQQQPSSDRNVAKPLNILVFYGDDWRHDQLGHLNPLIHSPNIDHELAGKGVRFTHNCVTTSVCGVSRATYYTGQYMSRHGTNRSIELFRPWPELFPYFLKQAGYHVGYVGKGGLFPFHWEQYDTCNMFEGYHIDEKQDNGRHITQRAEDEAITFLSKRPMDKPFYLTIAFYATHAVDEDVSLWTCTTGWEAHYRSSCT